MTDRIKIKYWWSEDKKWFCILTDDGNCQSTVSLTVEEASLLSMNAVLDPGPAQQSLRAAGEQETRGDEPVAWRYKCKDGSEVLMLKRLTEEQKRRGYYTGGDGEDEVDGNEAIIGPFHWAKETPLYATPQPSPRLEREGIAEMLKRNGFTSRDGTVIAADTLGVIDAILAMTVVTSTSRREPGDDYNPAYDEGITFAIVQLAELTGSKDWQMRDGSEDHDTDVCDTIMDVLKCAGLYDDDDGKFATLVTSKVQP